jgi:hypothetical protein
MLDRKGGPPKTQSCRTCRTGRDAKAGRRRRRLAKKKNVCGLCGNLRPHDRSRSCRRLFSDGPTRGRILVSVGYDLGFPLCLMHANVSEHKDTSLIYGTVVLSNNLACVNCRSKDSNTTGRDEVERRRTGTAALDRTHACTPRATATRAVHRLASPQSFAGVPSHLSLSLSVAALHTSQLLLQAPGARVTLTSILSLFPFSLSLTSHISHPHTSHHSLSIQS